MRRSHAPIYLCAALALGGCGADVSSPGAISVTRSREGYVAVRTSRAEFRVFSSGHVQPRLRDASGTQTLDTAGAVPLLTVAGHERPDVALELRDDTVVVPGRARRLVWRGRGLGDLAGLEKTLTLELSADAPTLALLGVEYQNQGTMPLALERIEIQHHSLDASQVAASPPYALFSFHGVSDIPGEDVVLPLSPGFARRNVTGLIGAKGRGGGLPVVAFWNARLGHVLGHAETEARALSLPVSVEAAGRVHAALALEPDGALPAGGRLSCPRAFVGAFRGDYYDALVAYRGLLDRQGYRPQPWSRRAYEPGWSSWGYRTDLTPARLRAVIPKLKALGLARVTIDEGWFGTYGDWQPRSQRFGAESIRDLVRELHRNGLSVDIYWVPLGVELGQLRHDGTHFGFAEVATAHPDWLILDAFGQPAGFVRRLAALCPALPEVQEYHRQLVRRFLGAWACDGQKLDNAFTVPACHNPKHHHRSPEDSVRAMGAVYRAVYETAREARPDGVTQICPCGTLPNLAWLPYMDQPIVADPWTSAQVRQRITVYKALFGADAPVSGDHVEMTGRRNTAQGLRMLGLDFASTIAVGGVPATRFVWPEEREETQDVFLTPEKELRWRRWLRLYWARRLAEGRFRHLYVHGVDAPEAYVVEKDGVMHYAFFAPERGVSWRHPVELRGLAPRPYRLRDYVAERELGVVRGPVATLAVGFEDALLIEARPQ